MAQPAFTPRTTQVKACDGKPRTAQQEAGNNRSTSQPGWVSASCAGIPGGPSRSPRFGAVDWSFALQELKRTQEAFDLLLPTEEKFPKNWIISYKSRQTHHCFNDAQRQLLRRMPVWVDNDGRTKADRPCGLS